MDTSAIYNSVTDLRDVLEAERAALISGHAREAVALMDRKMQALKAFDAIVEGAGSMPANSGLRADIEDIVGLARENASHFAAVRNGMNNAVTRLNSMSDTSYVGSYNANGARTPFPKASGGYVKKA